METDAVGCQPATEEVAETIVVAEAIVSDVIIDCSVVIIDEDDAIVAVSCSMLVA